MSTLDMTASQAEATQPGLMTRVLGAWASYQTRLTRSYVEQHLKRLSDEELKEMGYGGMDVARIRAAQDSAPQHWL